MAGTRFLLRDLLLISAAPTPAFAARGIRGKCLWSFSLLGKCPLSSRGEQIPRRLLKVTPPLQSPTTGRGVTQAPSFAWCSARHGTQAREGLSRPGSRGATPQMLRSLLARKRAWDQRGRQSQRPADSFRTTEFKAAGSHLFSMTGGDKLPVLTSASLSGFLQLEKEA